MNSQTLANIGTAGQNASSHSSQFKNDVIALIPQLRAFSRALCGGRTIAEDMAQEALAKAWRAQDRFENGTNLKAWLFTILRNEFFSHTRRAWREVRWNTEMGETIEAPGCEQEWKADLSDTVRAMRRLPDTQREALILVAVGGFSYAEAAEICGAPEGTIKSRVARARASLLTILHGNEILPEHSAKRMIGAPEYILAQLRALTPAGINNAAYA
jgi:RNA polymerase sigma-70 factor (ECF subfamily)